MVQNSTKNRKKLTHPEERLLERIKQGRSKPEPDNELDKLFEDMARSEVDAFADSRIDEYLNWFSNHENRKKLAAALRHVGMHLPKLLFVLEQLDGRPLPSISETKGEHFWHGNVVRYLVESGLLKWLADYAETFRPRKGSYAKKMCAHELVELFRNGRPGTPSYEKVGELLSKRFPDSKEDLCNYFDWVRQLVKRSKRGK